MQTANPVPSCFCVFLDPHAESLATSWSPHCLWNHKGFVEKLQWHRARPVPPHSIEKSEQTLKSRSVECIWQAQPTQTRPAVQHTWGDAGSADGPVSLHHVCFYYWEECDRGASSPYFIPVSVWSAGMETTGSCGYSKQLLFLKHISLFWLFTVSILSS